MTTVTNDPDELAVQYTISQDVPDVCTVPKSGAITFPGCFGGDQHVAVGEHVAQEMANTSGFCAVSFSNLGENVLGVIENELRTKFGHAQFTTRNRECIRITVDGDVRTFISYPSATKPLRGIDDKVTILEEATYVPPDA